MSLVGRSSPTDIFGEIMEFRIFSDEEKIKNMYKYFWVIGLFNDEEYSPEVLQAYELYLKMRDL